MSIRRQQSCVPAGRSACPACHPAAAGLSPPVIPAVAGPSPPLEIPGFPTNKSIRGVVAGGPTAQRPLGGPYRGAQSSLCPFGKHTLISTVERQRDRKEIPCQRHSIIQGSIITQEGHSRVMTVPAVKDRAFNTIARGTRDLFPPTTAGLSPGDDAGFPTAGKTAFLDVIYTVPKKRKECGQKHDNMRTLGGVVSLKCSR